LSAAPFAAMPTTRPIVTPAVTTQLAVSGAWSRATAPGASVGVAYFAVANSGAADELVAIESPVCEHVEMHATSMANGMMQMRRTESVSIPAGGRVVFEPSGLHAMLLGLKAPLRAGQRVPLTLIFRHAGRVPVAARVQGVESEGPPPEAAAASPSAAYKLSVWPPRIESPDFELVDPAGRVRRLTDYRGRIVVLFFGFVHCPDVCPAELFKLSLAMKKLGPLSGRVQVLFVSLDPARDTRKVLKTYVAAFDPRFVGLTGTTAQIDAAAASFFVEYARVGAGADYTIDHSTSTFVLDAAGRLRLVGAANAGVDDYAHDLAALAAL
jgi:protein SCO1/2